MTHEEYNSLKGEIFAEADRRYVVVDDCNEKQERINAKFAKDDKRIEIISHDFGIIKKLMWTITTACITSLVVTILELVFK